MITCAQCGHENKLGHMFCTRCRAKLDLQTHLDTKMLKGAVRSGRFGARRVAIIASVLIVIALLALALHPDSIKSAASSANDFTSICRKITLLETVSGAPPQSMTEAELNVYMDAVVARARKLDDTGLVASRINRVRLGIENDAVIVQVARTLGPFMLGPLNLGTLESSYELTGIPEAGEDGFRFNLKSGKRGLLPVPALFCRSAQAELEGFFLKLKKEREFLDRIAAIDVSDGEVVVSMKQPRQMER